MKTHIRRRCWLLISIVVAAMTALSVDAVDKWASEPALGDVAVSFDTQILLLDNANPDPATAVDTLSQQNVTGYGGMVFDAFLNLVATKTAPNGSGELVRFGPLHPHSRLAPNITTQNSPSALAIAADGTLYVASRSPAVGTPATIWRIKPDGSFGGAFTVPADTATCIGIDLDPDQSTLYYASGGRAVRTVSGVSGISAPKTAPATPTPSLFTTLPGNNLAACGLRLLAPPDLRETTPAPPLDLVRLVVADGKDVKLVTSSPGQTPVVVSYDAGNGNKNWIDVALDPNVEDFWAVDAASWHLAKFRRGSAPTTLLVEDLPGQPRGVAINGELRAAQTVRLVTVTTTAESIVTFWPQNTATRFSWVGQGTTAGASFAIQAFEVTYDAATGGSPNVNTGLCDPSLNIRCRLVTNFSDATPKPISRGRFVVIREIVRSIPVVTSDVFRIGIAYIDFTSTSGGSACVPGTVAPASTLLRDPWPHAVFDFDAGLAVFGGDDTVYTKTTRNDNIVVNRTKPAVKYNLLIVNPDPGTSFKVGSSLPVSVEVRDPSANCADVPNLNDFLVLTVTDVTTHPGVPVSDSEGIYGTVLDGQGGGWAKTASLYRTNLITNSLLPNHTYRLCVGLPASTTVDGAADQVFEAPLAAEQCRDVTAKR